MINDTVGFDSLKHDLDELYAWNKTWRTCPECGKLFIAHDKVRWAYRNKKTNELLCSYTCSRKVNKEYYEEDKCNLRVVHHRNGE